MEILRYLSGSFDKKSKIFFFITFTFFKGFSQVAFNANPTDTQITSVLNGGGLSISGANLIRGDRAMQIATFSNGISGANLGADTGVYFSTGDVNFELSNKNTVTSSTFSANFDYYSDSDLITLDPFALYDPLIYSFNVTLGGTNNGLRIVYQFGSEEYPDYVGSEFNDAFGFFVSGPGIVGVANLAKLPSNNSDITVNNVNYGLEGQYGSGLADLTQSAYYLINGHTTQMNGTRLELNTVPQPGPFPYFVEFNGLTRLLTFDLAGLTPGATYTFKIAIADTSDNQLDSGVFIKKISAENTADVAVSKSVNNSSQYVGSNVVFTINASNNGPQNATNTVVNDLLPSGYTFVSATTSQGSYDSNSGIWNVGNLNVGASATLSVTAMVNNSGNYLNVANITSSEIDANLTNNTSSVNVTPLRSADLSVEKVVDNSSPMLGSNVVFTINAKNLGDSDATGVVVSDVLPSGYLLISATPSNGIWSAPNWTIGNLSNGSSETLTITAQVLGMGNYNNTAVISGNEIDFNLSNNTDTENVNPLKSIDAVNDNFLSNPIVGSIGGVAGDVTLNDTLFGLPVNDTDISIVLNNNGGISGLTINSNGLINVPAGTPPGTYTITYTICENSFPANCDSADVQILVENKTISSEIIIYNHFTPNGDGNNEFFFIEGIENFPNNTVQIYNRWGVLVYETEGYNNTDKIFKGESKGRGTIQKNEQLPEGTYYYILKYLKANGETIEKANYLYINR